MSLHSDQTCTLLLTDTQRSTLMARSRCGFRSHAYTAFGYSQHQPTGNDGFQGQWVEHSTGHYLLGNGYRAYNPALMRFISPDSYSPFGTGGLNTYAFVSNDPINSSDPSGHNPYARLMWFTMERIYSSEHGIMKGFASVDGTLSRVFMAHNFHDLNGKPAVTGLNTPQNEKNLFKGDDIANIYTAEDRMGGFPVVAAFCNSATAPPGSSETFDLSGSAAGITANTLQQPVMGFLDSIYGVVDKQDKYFNKYPANHYGIFNKIPKNGNWSPVSIPRVTVLNSDYLPEAAQKKRNSA